MRRDLFGHVLGDRLATARLGSGGAGRTRSVGRGSRGFLCGCIAPAGLSQRLADRSLLVGLRSLGELDIDWWRFLRLRLRLPRLVGLGRLAGASQELLDLSTELIGLLADLGRRGPRRHLRLLYDWSLHARWSRFAARLGDLADDQENQHAQAVEDVDDVERGQQWLDRG
jgi:hypothetical protein